MPNYCKNIYLRQSIMKKNSIARNLLLCIFILSVFIGCRRLVDEFERMKWEVENISDSQAIHVRTEQGKFKDDIEIIVFPEGGNCVLKCLNYQDFWMTYDETMLEDKLLSEGIKCDIKDDKLTISIEGKSKEITGEPIIFYVSVGFAASQVSVIRCGNENR